MTKDERGSHGPVQQRGSNHKLGTEPGTTDRSSWLTSVRQWVTEVSVLFGVIVVASVLLFEFFNEDAQVEPFDVPQWFKDRGLTGDQLARRLVDYVNDIQVGAETAMTTVSGSKLVHMELPQSVSQAVVIPGTTFALSQLVLRLRQLFGVEPSRIGGALLGSEDGDATLVIRISHHGQKLSKAISWRRRAPDGGRQDETIDLGLPLREAATFVAESIEPFVLAAYVFKRDLVQATRLAVRALETAPDTDDPWAHNLLGLIHFRRQQLQEAARSLQAAAEHPAGSSQAAVRRIAHTNWGETLSAMGDSSGALKHFELAHAADPKSATPYIQACHLLATSRRHTQALGYCRQAVKIEPRKARVYWMTGVALEHAGENEAGLEWYRRAVEVEPSSAVAHNNLSWALLVRGSLATAYDESLLAKSLVDSGAGPPLASLYDTLGWVAYKVGRLDNARKAFKESLRLAPNDGTESYVGLAMALDASGRHEKAVAMLARATRLTRATRQGKSRLLVGRCRAWVAAANGRPDEGIERLRRVAKFAAVPDRNDVDADLVWMVTTRGRAEDARKLVKLRRTSERPRRSIDASRLCSEHRAGALRAAHVPRRATGTSQIGSRAKSGGKVQQTASRPPLKQSAIATR